MIAHARGIISEILEGGVALQIFPSFKNKVAAFLGSYLKKDKDIRPLINLTMVMECEIKQTRLGGFIDFRFIDSPDIYIEASYREKTDAQMSTLRGIERFIFWATEGYKSRGDRDIYYIHEALIEMYSKPVKNPVTGNETMMRTSDPNMDVVTLSRIINGGLNWLSTLEIPDDVLATIGRPVKELWTNWYKWRYENGNGDPLYDDEMTYSWEKYIEVHPVCECCGQPEFPGDPLERMHIITEGADKTIYEKPWNWIHSHRSHHSLMHNSGWKAVIDSYPVIKGKVERAYKVWNEGGRR